MKRDRRSSLLAVRLLKGALLSDPHLTTALVENAGSHAQRQ